MFCSSSCDEKNCLDVHYDVPRVDVCNILSVMGDAFRRCFDFHMGN